LHIQNDGFEGFAGASLAVRTLVDRRKCAVY
jgi:hypothetical protein